MIPQTNEAKVYQLRIWLKGISPMIWRRILVRDDSTIADFHYTIQILMDWETKNQTVLPRRGSIHDMGPTLTHKKIIIHKLFVEQKTVQQTSRETLHSLPAIQRYISAFSNVGRKRRTLLY